jgi:hypothetical protein
MVEDVDQLLDLQAQRVRLPRRIESPRRQQVGEPVAQLFAVGNGPSTAANPVNHCVTRADDMTI